MAIWSESSHTSGLRERDGIGKEPAEMIAQKMTLSQWLLTLGFETVYSLEHAIDFGDNHLHTASLLRPFCPHITRSQAVYTSYMMYESWGLQEPPDLIAESHKACSFYYRDASKPCSFAVLISVMLGVLFWLALLLSLGATTQRPKVHLHFTPSALDVIAGQIVEVNVNVTAYHSDHAALYTLHYCCTDDSIVEVDPGTPLSIRNDSWISQSIKVRGIQLGRTKLRFYVTREDFNQSLVSSNYSSWENNSDNQQWWLRDEYAVIVKRSHSPVRIYLNYALMGLISINLMAIGGQVNLNEMVKLVKKPIGLSVAFLCRFAFVPALGLGFVMAFQPDTTIAMGVLSLMCSPSEGASAMLSTLLEGDLTFCVVLLIINNFAAVAMLPLWTILFEMKIYSSAGNVRIPFRDIFILFTYMTTSLTAGFAVQRKLPKCYALLWLYLPSFTIFTLFTIVILDLYQYSFIFTLITVKTTFLCIFIVIGGYSVVLGCAYIARLPPMRMLVVTMEIGVRTSYIPCLAVHVSFPDPERDIAKTSTLLAILLSVLPTIVGVLVYRFYKKRFEEEHPHKMCEEDDSESEQQVEPLAAPLPEVIDAKETAI
ncbi:hypothetical protein CAPTEDRAFT_223681 [Capitella teleta]|uniref:Uncharacterized protein n=1 Tax=Capitella teleta TaxID=283909 RepID=R7USP2_CAPTE|nr:hypothetical protein CAPTEDRAFT_223681 [Capitella teleta]|eukprot:ELU09519.1 hypothetical protein CAPTEDRAFT_223681 [Capitella teleta]